MGLIALIKRVFRISFIRFLFVAGINTCFGYSMFALWVFLLKNMYLAVVVSTVINVLFNFNTYGRIVFKSKDHSRVFRFFGVYLISMSLNMLFLKILSEVGVTNPYIAGAILVLPLALLSFTLMKKYVFNTAVPAKKSLN